MSHSALPRQSFNAPEPERRSKAALKIEAKPASTGAEQEGRMQRLSGSGGAITARFAGDLIAGCSNRMLADD